MRQIGMSTAIPPEQVSGNHVLNEVTTSSFYKVLNGEQYSVLLPFYQALDKLEL